MKLHQTPILLGLTLLLACGASEDPPPADAGVTVTPDAAAADSGPAPSPDAGSADIDGGSGEVDAGATDASGPGAPDGGDPTPSDAGVPEADAGGFVPTPIGEVRLTNPRFDTPSSLIPGLDHCEELAPGWSLLFRTNSSNLGTCAPGPSDAPGRTQPDGPNMLYLASSGDVVWVTAEASDTFTLQHGESYEVRAPIGSVTNQWWPQVIAFGLLEEGSSPVMLAGRTVALGKTDPSTMHHLVATIEVGPDLHGRRVLPMVAVQSSSGPWAGLLVDSLRVFRTEPSTPYPTLHVFNGSFEYPRLQHGEFTTQVEGWQVSAGASGFAGRHRLPGAAFVGDRPFAAPGDGVTALELGGGTTPRNGVFAIATSEPAGLADGNPYDYLLTFAVARRADFPVAARMLVEVLAGGTVIATQEVLASEIDMNTWHRRTLTVPSGPEHAGQPLQVRFTVEQTGGRLLIDSVWLGRAV